MTFPFWEGLDCTLGFMFWVAPESKPRKRRKHKSSTRIEYRIRAPVSPWARVSCQIAIRSSLLSNSFNFASSHFIKVIGNFAQVKNGLYVIVWLRPCAKGGLEGFTYVGHKLFGRFVNCAHRFFGRLLAMCSIANAHACIVRLMSSLIS